LTEPASYSTPFRRLATAAAFAGPFAFALTATIIPAAVNQISPLCNNRDTLIGWLLGVPMIGFLACVLAGGRLSDTHGKLPVLCVGCALMAVGSCMFARAYTYPVALAAALVMGAGGGCTEAIAMAVVVEVFSAERRTSMMNCAQVFFAAGAVAGPLGVTWLLAKHIDWRWSLVVTSGFCALASALALAAIGKREERPIGRGHVGEWRALLGDPLVIVYALGVMLYVGAEAGQAGWLARYFANDLGAAGPLAAFTVGLFWVGIGVGRAIAAWSAKHLTDYAIICWSLGFATVLQTVLLLFHSAIPALITVPLLGFALASVWPTILSRAGALHPAQTGTVLGVVVAAGGVGAGIFPPAIGQAADAIGLRRALWICPVLIAVNFAVFMRLWARHRAQSEAR